MAHGLVKTKADEKKWQLAMSIVKKQYKKSEKDGVEFWRITTGVFKNLNKKKGKKKSAADELRRIAHELTNNS